MAKMCRGRSSKVMTGTAPGGSNVARARAPSASRHARSGELRHSTGTRSELRVCLKTHGMLSDRSTRTVLLDTPPRRTDSRTPLPEGMPCASRYARDWLASSMSSESRLITEDNLFRAWCVHWALRFLDTASQNLYTDAKQERIWGALCSSGHRRRLLEPIALASNHPFPGNTGEGRAQCVRPTIGKGKQ